MRERATSLPPEQEAIRAKCFHPSGTFVVFPKEEIEQSIPERFEKIVRMYPDGVAVRVRDAQITYGELNRVANRVAHSIIEKTGRANEPIVILLEEGIEAISAILGVLKARRFYIPLAPSTPRRRLLSILQDSGAQVIVTDNRNPSLLNELAGNGSLVLGLDELDRGLSSDNLCLYASPRSLCAIRYTSGTSGDPKGVMHAHIKVLHTAMVNTNDLHLCSQDRCAAHGHDYFNSLLIGASFYLYNIAESGWTHLSSWLLDNEITTYDTTPALFRQFCSTQICFHGFPRLRLIKLEGEPAVKEDVELCKKYFSDRCVLINRFGTRETGGFRQLFVDKASEITSMTLPAGYAFGAKEVLLLDDDGKEVQEDHPGEIAVISQYLAAGYWRRPDLTQASFVPIDEGGDTTKYLTGDLGRFHRDGCLEYLGRKDDQMKLGGQKIHPVEIEAALIEYGGVTEAVVKLETLNVKRHCLTAYLLSADAAQLNVRELRQALRERLPDCMVPSRFVFLDVFPLGPTGKIDRSALPQPDHSRPQLHSPYTEGRTPIEEKVSGIWAEVLDLDRVGIHDDFFELGGHSLSAMRIIHRVIEAFGLELPIKALFDAPTVAAMAAIIGQNQTKPANQAGLVQILRELEAMTEEEAQKQLLGESELMSHEKATRLFTGDAASKSGGKRNE